MIVMLKKITAIAVTLVLAACGGPQRPRFGDGVIDRALAGAPGMAQPSTIVAAELAFARAAQEQGQWTAFAQFAADDALMFVPELVNAKQWLKAQQDPAQAVSWQPHQVWMSCDGSLAVTKGAWQRGERAGYFTTVWQRQDDGGYKWVMDQGDVLADPLDPPEFIASKISDCRDVSKPPPPPRPQSLYEEGTRQGAGSSRDGMLRYDWVYLPDGRRVSTAEIFLKGEWQQIIAIDVPPEEKSAE